MNRLIIAFALLSLIVGTLASKMSSQKALDYKYHSVDDNQDGIPDVMDDLKAFRTAEAPAVAPEPDSANPDVQSDFFNQPRPILSANLLPEVISLRTEFAQMSQSFLAMQAQESAIQEIMNSLLVQVTDLNGRQNYASTALTELVQNVSTIQSEVVALQNATVTYGPGTVYFYATRNSDYTDVDTIIPYDNITVNSNAMSNTSGIFTAPVDGVYNFGFSAVSLLSANVALVKNNVTMATAAAGTDEQSISMSVVLSLLQGDQVAVKLISGGLSESVNFLTDNRFTQFTGFLLN